jgi:ATP synthase protein I
VSDAPDPHSPARRPTLGEQVGAKEARKLKAQRRPAPSVWTGFATFGLVGWSVAVPTLLGAALGWWLDRHFAGTRSWTLALLIAGLVLGCINAWHWVSGEERAMRRERDSDNE